MAQMIVCQAERNGKAKATRRVEVDDDAPLCPVESNRIESNRIESSQQRISPGTVASRVECSAAQFNDAVIDSLTHHCCDLIATSLLHQTLSLSRSLHSAQSLCAPPAPPRLAPLHRSALSPPHSRLQCNLSLRRSSFTMSTSAASTLASHSMRLHYRVASRSNRALTSTRLSMSALPLMPIRRMSLMCSCQSIQLPAVAPHAICTSIRQFASKTPVEGHAEGDLIPRSELQSRVISVIRQFLTTKFPKSDKDSKAIEAQAASVTPEAHFTRDLGLDSLDTVELAMVSRVMHMTS